MSLDPGNQATTVSGVRSVSTDTGRLILTVVILCVAVAFAIGSSAIEGRTGRFPLALAILTIIFTLIEILNQLRVIRRKAAAHVADIAAMDDKAISCRTEKIIVCAWFMLTIFGILFAGVLITSFVAGIAYFRFIDQQTNARALVAGSILTLSIWVIFELLAGFTLYEGTIW